MGAKSTVANSFATIPCHWQLSACTYTRVLGPFYSMRSMTIKLPSLHLCGVYQPVKENSAQNGDDEIIVDAANICRLRHRCGHSSGNGVYVQVHQARVRGPEYVARFVHVAVHVAKVSVE